MSVDRFDAVDINEATVQTLSPTAVVRAGRVRHYPANSGKVGATAGFAFTNNAGVATVPASQSGSTLTIPITGLVQGDVITGFTASGQIESAGGTVTVDVDLRATTAAAADLSDASIGAITQISKTADYEINDSKTGLSHTVIQGNSYYALVTVTTAASTDVAFQGIELTTTEA